jgi:hypothetical protein
LAVSYSQQRALLLSLLFAGLVWRVVLVCVSLIKVCTMLILELFLEVKCKKYKR